MTDEEQGEASAPPPTQGQSQSQTRNTTHHITSATALFPSSLCSSVITIINLLNDAAVSSDGIAVYDVAYQVSIKSIIYKSFDNSHTRIKEWSISKLNNRMKLLW